jgi:hypothetical protein
MCVGKLHEGNSVRNVTINLAGMDMGKCRIIACMLEDKVIPGVEFQLKKGSDGIRAVV